MIIKMYARGILTGLKITDGVVENILGEEGMLFYYQPDVAENAYLVGLTYGLSGGGLLLPVTEPCECDLNKDHSCNFLDYQIFIKELGATDCNQPGVDCPCDLNSDGRCNIVDYQLFIQDWDRKNCPVRPES